MYNELDHSLMRAVLNTVRRGGKRPPKIINVVSRHFCRKLGIELAKWRSRRQIQVKEQAGKAKSSNAAVARSIKQLKKALSKKICRPTFAMTVAKSEKLQYVNEQMHKHKQNNGPSTQADYNRLSGSFKHEFENLEPERKAVFSASYKRRLDFARSAHDLAGGRKKRRRGAQPVMMDAPVPPPVTPSLHGLGDRHAVTVATVRTLMGGKKSYTDVSADITSGKGCVPSLGVLSSAPDTSVDPKALGKYRVSQLTCGDRHCGMCRTKDRAVVARIAALRTQLTKFMQAHLPPVPQGSPSLMSIVGLALLSLTMKYPTEEDPILFPLRPCHMSCLLDCKHLNTFPMSQELVSVGLNSFHQPLSRRSI